MHRDVLCSNSDAAAVGTSREAIGHVTFLHLITGLLQPSIFGFFFPRQSSGTVVATKASNQPPLYKPLQHSFLAKASCSSSCSQTRSGGTKADDKTHATPLPQLVRARSPAPSQAEAGMVSELHRSRAAGSGCREGSGSWAVENGCCKVSVLRCTSLSGSINHNHLRLGLKVLTSTLKKNCGSCL